MALAISTSIAVNDTTSSYRIDVTGKLSIANFLEIDMYIGGVLVGSEGGVGTTYQVISSVTALEVWTNISGHTRTNGVYCVARERTPDPAMTVLQTSAQKYGNITINTRNTISTPTSPTTTNPLDISLADPVNIIASVGYPSGNPSNFFKTWTEVLVWNGTSYVLAADFSSIGSVNANIANTSADGIAITNAMGQVSPRSIKLIFYTACVFEQLWVVGSAGRTTIITDGLINSNYMGGKIKVLSSSFLSKPLKYFNGSTWIEKPIKHWNGLSWAKSKN
jgi:hypothetical protein